MDRLQVSEDFKDIETALTHALTYPKRVALSEEAYNAAHAELQDALLKLKRVKRSIDGSIIGTTLEKGNR